MNKARTQFFIILAICASLIPVASVLGQSRLSFSRPGGMMRIPMSSAARSPYLFNAGFATEVFNISPFNRAAGVYFDSEVTKNFRFGLSSVTTADTSRDLASSTFRAPLEVGFHLHYKLWTYGNISFTIGAEDILLTQDSSNFNIFPKLMSYVGVLSSEQNIGSYTLNSYMGFGTGVLGGATYENTASADSNNIKMGVFAGFKINTPIFAKMGGIDLIGEFDGRGVNVGIRIPITPDYHLQLGFIHVESIPQFGIQSEGNEALNVVAAPAVVVGLNLSVPRLTSGPIKSAEAQIYEMGPRIDPLATDGSMDSALLDSTLMAADALITATRDSLNLKLFENQNLLNQVAMLEQKGIVFADSILSMQLRIQMMKSNMNATMRHLSASMANFYREDFREALQEVEMAIQLNPDLAVAYARRGSIYFKLGDTQRATINWNLALQLDPAYDDIRNTLTALKEGRLQTTTLIQQR